MSDIPTWPTTLPQVPASQGRKVINTNDVFESQKGKPLRWANSTVFMREVSLVFECNKSQINEFWEFYRVDTKNGAQSFYMADPANEGIVCLWDFVEPYPNDDWVEPDFFRLYMTLLQTRAE